MQLKDYYSILGLPPHATLPEIKKAYRRLAMTHHPDKNEGNAYAVAYFHDIKEAYETLTNPVKKDQYLQKRWYFQSRGKKFEAYKPSLPETVLGDAIQLNKYVHTLNPFRVDKQSLYKYIRTLVNNESIEMLKRFNEQKVNAQIVELLLDATSYLDAEQGASLSEQLKAIVGNDPLLLARIDQKNRKMRSEAFFKKYELLVIIIVTLVICLLIWLSV